MATKDVRKFKETFKHMVKQIEAYTEEQNLWSKKLQRAYQDLQKLKMNIKSSKYVDILEVYQNCKDLELELSKKNMENHHISSIEMDAISEIKKLRQSLALSCEILQKYYEKFGIVSEIKHKLDELQRIVHLNIYLDENDKSLINAESAKILLNGKRHNNNIIDDDTNELKKQKLTLVNQDCDADIGLDVGIAYPSVSRHTEISRNMSLNTTHIILPPSGSGSTSDWNKTFEMKADCEKSSNELAVTPEGLNQMAPSGKKTYLDNILSENITVVSKNKNFVQKELLKAQNFGHREIVKTVTLGIRKENKKNSPNRVRKSPRPILRRPAISNASKNNGTVPIVRTNRAASFRIKK